MAERSKIIFKKADTDYGLEDFITPRCFSVGSNVKLKDIPSNGEEYLLAVINERTKYAPVLHCDYKQYKSLVKNVPPQSNEVVNPSTTEILTIKPTIEWQNIQIADFSEVRMYIQKMLAKGLLPDVIKDTESTKHRVKDWRPLFDEEEPTMTHAVGLSQSIIDNGIDVLIKRLDSIKPGETIDYRIGQWIYTLLAVTRYPHLQDTTAKLRVLARKCIEIRSKIKYEDENAKELAAPMNLFICLIARYFGQKDLAD